MCGGGAETYAELHSLHEPEKTQPTCPYETKERQRSDTRGNFFFQEFSVLNIRDFVLCSEHLNAVALTVSKESLQSLRLFSFGCNSVLNPGSSV